MVLSCYPTGWSRVQNSRITGTITVTPFTFCTLISSVFQAGSLMMSIVTVTSGHPATVGSDKTGGRCTVPTYGYLCSVETHINLIHCPGEIVCTFPLVSRLICLNFFKNVLHMILIVSSVVSGPSRPWRRSTLVCLCLTLAMLDHCLMGWIWWWTRARKPDFEGETYSRIGLLRIYEKLTVVLDYY
jgi:hypothetical protein